MAGSTKGRAVRRHFPSTRRILNYLYAAAAIIAGCSLLAIASSDGNARWFAIFGLFPLLHAIRTTGPMYAAFCGALWGLGLILFSGGPVSGINALQFFSVAMGAPALYAGVASWFTRWQRYSPVALAAGWIGVELLFAGSGWPGGILCAFARFGSFFGLISGFLGGGFVAFLCILLDASLILCVEQVRAHIGKKRPRNLTCVKEYIYPVAQIIEITSYANALLPARAPPSTFP